MNKKLRGITDGGKAKPIAGAMTTPKPVYCQPIANSAAGPYVIMTKEARAKKRKY